MERYRVRSSAESVGFIIRLLPRLIAKPSFDGCNDIREQIRGESEVLLSSFESCMPHIG